MPNNLALQSICVIFRTLVGHDLVILSARIPLGQKLSLQNNFHFFFY